MTVRWSVSDVKECQVDVWRLFKDRFGIIDGCFHFAIAARPVGLGHYVLKAKGLGELPVFMRHKLGTVVHKAA